MRALFTAVLVLGLAGCTMRNPGFELGGHGTGGSSNTGDQGSGSASETTSSTTGQGTDGSASKSTTDSTSSGDPTSDGTGASTTNASSTSGITTDSSTTGTSDASTSGVITSGTFGDTGLIPVDLPPLGCLGPEDCKPSEYCQFPPEDPCGVQDTPGGCKPRPANCMAIYDPVTGCDCKLHENACVANMAGYDVACEGNQLCC